MATNSPQHKGRDLPLSTLDITKDACSIPPAQVAFGSVSVLLTTIKDTVANEQEYADIGSTCANVCEALDRGLNGRQLDEVSRAVLEAIQQLTTTVVKIQKKIVKQSKRDATSRFFHAKRDKDEIAAWKLELHMILHVFNTELSVNNHMMLLDIRRDLQVGQGGTDELHQPTQAKSVPATVAVDNSIPVGELPPPQPKACFGRDGLIEKIVGLADTLNPIALIGPGGIGKTSLALAVLHHNRIKDRFGSNRRFIPCDQFQPSRANFLRQLSKVIGAGVENPEDLAPLRPFLSSEEMFIVLDNAESILDPQGTDGRGIYRVVEELSQCNNICLCITSRITTVPPDCECLEVPTLSMDAARSTFRRIYHRDGRSDLVDKILGQLDFHPLSVTLLATVAHQNKWDTSRLAREWERRQTGVLHDEYNDNLAATIELSLSSPLFKELGPDARELLGVIAFFPQGVDENNLDWLFPTISDISAIFNKFCSLSLSYRSGDFVTMLAPLRDYLHPIDPTKSPLLCTTKELYFTRLSSNVDLDDPTFGETQWIVSEDVNVEHLLDVFTSIDPGSEDVWDAYADFMAHLYWHKPRQTILRSKIEQLPDEHPSKPGCLFQLSRLSDSLGNAGEQKSLLLCVLALHREKGDDYLVAETLLELSIANRALGLIEEAIQQAKEALEIMERVGYTTDQARCLNALAYSLHKNKQLDAAQEAASRSIELSGEGQELEVCRSHRILGQIYSSKDERTEAIRHYEVALGIATSSGWRDQMFCNHHSMARLFYDEDNLDKAQAHITQAKVHVDGDPYLLGLATEMQARIWYRRRRPEDAISEASRAVEIFERLGSEEDLEKSRALLRDIEQRIKNRAASGKSDSSARSISSGTSVNSP